MIPALLPKQLTTCPDFLNFSTCSLVKLVPSSTDPPELVIMLIKYRKYLFVSILTWEMLDLVKVYIPIVTLQGCSKGGGRGAAAPPQILADQLTLSQPGGTDYAHLITTGTPGFSDLPTALNRWSSDSFDINTIVIFQSKFVSKS